MDRKNPNDPQKVCKSCGFCCDGTLFDTASIELEQHPIIIVKKDSKKELHFKHPCTAHIEGECSIYNDRPEACYFYECKLLRKLNSNIIPEEKAMLQISLTQHLIEELDELMYNETPDLEGVSHYHRYHNFKAKMIEKMGKKAYFSRHGILEQKLFVISETLKEHFYEGER